MKADREDHGIWRCVLTSPDDLHTLTTFTDLGVALTPLTSINIPGADITTTSTINSTTSTTVQLEENKEYNLTCTARQAFPRWCSVSLLNRE